VIKSAECTFDLAHYLVALAPSSSCNNLAKATSVPTRNAPLKPEPLETIVTATAAAVRL